MPTHDEAIARLLEAVAVLPTETLLVENAARRYLAKPVRAAIDTPRENLDDKSIRRAFDRNRAWRVLRAGGGGSLGHALRLLHCPNGSDAHLYRSLCSQRPGLRYHA